MKTLSCVQALILTFSVLAVSHGVGQSNVVHYGCGADSVSVAFVDTNLAESVRASIVADLQLCLQEWGKQSELDLGTYEPGLAGYLYNPDRCPHYPEGIGFPKRLTTNQTGALTLEVTTTLSDAYTNAFAFITRNSNSVAAAYNFVRFVSSTNFYGVTSNQISNYVLYNQATPQLYQLCFLNITNSLRHSNYYPPSALGFYHNAIGPAATNLWIRVPSSSNPYGDVIEWSISPAIWHDNKWKFCVWEEHPHYELTH